jgi:enoyl-[acyl-carrier-protein] reductase (NADH)
MGGGLRDAADSVAESVLYFVSDLSTFLLGEIRFVNGGAVLVG